MVDETQLLDMAEAYADARGLRLSSVSTYASGSGHTFARLRNGHTITSKRSVHIVQYFSDHWPADLPWPRGIQRPAPAPDSPAGEALAAATAHRRLGADGRIADAEAFVRAAARPLRPDDPTADQVLRSWRKTYYDVVAEYGDGGPKSHPNREPVRGQARHVFDELLMSGDARFADRIAFNARTLDALAVLRGVA